MVDYDGETYLTAKEVANALGTGSAEKIITLARRLGIPTFKIFGHGATRFWRRSDLRLFYKPVQIKYNENGKIMRVCDTPKIKAKEIGGEREGGDESAK